MTEETTREFLRRLWAIQDERRLTNSQLARLLGITPSYVRRLKTRTTVRSIGYRIALAAAREFPELAVFLTSDLPTIQSHQTEGKETTESDQ